MCTEIDTHQKRTETTETETKCEFEILNYKC